jgi:hypothetical protein
MEGHNADEFSGMCVGHCIAPIEASTNGWLRFDNVHDLEDAIYTHWSEIQEYFCGNMQGFLERLKELKHEHLRSIFVLAIGRGNSPLAVLFNPVTVLGELHWIEEMITNATTNNHRSKHTKHTAFEREVHSACVERMHS